VTLTLQGESPTLPWRVLSLEILVADANEKDREISDNNSINEQLMQHVQGRMMEAQHPLVELWSHLRKSTISSPLLSSPLLSSPLLSSPLLSSPLLSSPLLLSSSLLSSLSLTHSVFVCLLPLTLIWSSLSFIFSRQFLFGITIGYPLHTVKATECNSSVRHDED
jgi:hypothetical protein